MIVTLHTQGLKTLAQVQALPLSRLMTPPEKFRSLPETTRYLKPGIILEKLDAIATEYSDNEAAQR